MSEAATIAAHLSDGAKNMLLHMARIQPLPKPYPPVDIGQFHLRELMLGELIARVSETRFVPTTLGEQVAAALKSSPTGEQG